MSVQTKSALTTLVVIFSAAALSIGVTTLVAQTPSDRFAAELRTLITPATDAFSPTLSDTTNEPAGVCRAFIAETDGTVKVTTLDGTVIQFTMVKGQEIRLRCKKFWQTGTTATVKCLVKCFPTQRTIDHAPEVLVCARPGFPNARAVRTLAA